MTVTLTLERKLDYRVIRSLTDDLKASIGQDIVLDASQTVQIGAQAAQILMAAAISSLKSGRTLRMANVSAPLESQLTLLGLRVADVEAGGDSDARAWS